MATYVALGAFYATQQQFNAAEQSFRKALEIEPKNIAHLLRLANLYAA
jgi:cytochrome c-type biogenesis protein CcmH/NrfG